MLKSKATRIVGVDFGMQRIGLAVSDETKTIAFPAATIKTGKKMEETVALFLKEVERDAVLKGYTVAEFVVGMPFLMSGATGLMADEVRVFISCLQAASTTPVSTWDERLTSVQADRSLRESSLTRKKRSAHVDTVSAVLILQNFLDHKKMQHD